MKSSARTVPNGARFSTYGLAAAATSAGKSRTSETASATIPAASRRANLAAMSRADAAAADTTAFG